jgi:hypothetical protein
MKNYTILCNAKLHNRKCMRSLETVDMKNLFHSRGFFKKCFYPNVLPVIDQVFKVFKFKSTLRCFQIYRTLRTRFILREMECYGSNNKGILGLKYLMIIYYLYR